jgi:hypothetical protein
MRQLKEAFIALCLIIILHFIKQTLSYHSPSYFFFYNCISCCQLLILLLVIGIILFQIIIGNRISPGKSFYIPLGLSLLILVGLEVVCSYLLNHPQNIPGTLKRSFRIYNSQFDLNTFQGDPAACRYDTSLFYSIRPHARVLFSNREYSDSFIINDRGFRSTDSECVQPEIISLGDSYSMGLGVRQNETYSFLVEMETGMKTLNTGVSSYGTARESISLRSTDTSMMRYIIWQYCSNDASENNDYVRRAFNYSPPLLSYFEYLQQLNAWDVKYFPGKCFLTLFKIAFRNTIGKKEKANREFQQITPNQQAINFLEIVKHSAINFAKTKIIVFELDSYQMSNRFPRSLKALLITKEYKELSKNIIVVDMSPVLEKDNYFILDNHLNASGHRIVADVLKRTLMRVNGAAN